MEKAGKVRKGDGLHVDHKNFNPRNNSPSNLRVVSQKINSRRQPKRK
ncbi:HNH endonuclease [Microcystis sp. M31BS1]